MSLVAVTATVDEPLLALLEEALGLIEPGDSVLRVELLSAITTRVMWRDPHGEAADLAAEAVAMAKRLGDDHALAAAVMAEQFVLSGTPESPRDRLANAELLIEVAGRSGDLDLAVRGYAYKLHCMLELGDVEQAEEVYRDYARVARELRQPQHLWHLPLFQGVQAMMDGRFEEAERLAEEARRGGERAQEPLAGQLHAVQMAVIRQQQGRLEEALPAVREMARRFPVIRAWQLTLNGFQAELGQIEEARLGFERFAAAGFDEIPRDLQWLPAMIRLVDTCHWLGDAERAEELLEMLEPFSGLAVIVGRADLLPGTRRPLPRPPRADRRAARRGGREVRGGGRAGGADARPPERARGALRARTGARRARRSPATASARSRS